MSKARTETDNPLAADESEINSHKHFESRAVFEIEYDRMMKWLRVQANECFNARPELALAQGSSVVDRGLGAFGVPDQPGSIRRALLTDLQEGDIGNHAPPIGASRTLAAVGWIFLLFELSLIAQQVVSDGLSPFALIPGAVASGGAWLAGRYLGLLMTYSLRNSLPDEWGLFQPKADRAQCVALFFFGQAMLYGMTMFRFLDAETWELLEGWVPTFTMLIGLCEISVVLFALSHYNAQRYDFVRRKSFTAQQWLARIYHADKRDTYIKWYENAVEILRRGGGTHELYDRTPTSQPD